MVSGWVILSKLRVVVQYYSFIVLLSLNSSI